MLLNFLSFSYYNKPLSPWFHKICLFIHLFIYLFLFFLWFLKKYSFSARKNHVLLSMPQETGKAINYGSVNSKRAHPPAPWCIWGGAWARLELTKPLIRLVLVRPRYTVQEVTWHTHLTSGFNFFSRVKVVLWFKIILFVSCYLTNWILQKLRTEISVLTESAFDRLVSFSNWGNCLKSETLYQKAD